MIDRRAWRYAIGKWLSTAESPIRIADLVKGALDGTGEMKPEDFTAVRYWLKTNGWRRQRSEFFHGAQWVRKAEREDAA